VINYILYNSIKINLQSKFNLKIDLFNTILPVIDFTVSGLLDTLYVNHMIAINPYKRSEV
jgi:hypothetical protein